MLHYLKETIRNSDNGKESNRLHQNIVFNQCWRGQGSSRRQREAINAFAKRAGYEIVAEYADEGVSGADPIDGRPGLIDALARIAGNGVRTIIVETANRFARDLIVQEVGYRQLRAIGVTLIAADSPNSFVDTTPTAVLIRQVLGAVSQFEKASLVAKLKGARDRKARDTGKCGGRKSYIERNAAMVAKAKELAQTKHGRSRSLRDVAADLEAAGHVSAKGTRFAPAAVARMLAA